MDSMIAAVIGGIFSLIGIWYTNRIQERRERRQNDLSNRTLPMFGETANNVAETQLAKQKADLSYTAQSGMVSEVTHPARIPQFKAGKLLKRIALSSLLRQFFQNIPGEIRKLLKRIVLGSLMLVADYLLMAIVMVVFDSNNSNPWWWILFGFLVLGAIPVYALYLILSGFYLLLKQAFSLVDLHFFRRSESKRK